MNGNSKAMKRFNETKNCFFENIIRLAHPWPTNQNKDRGDSNLK
jgi:hypothetical protein